MTNGTNYLNAEPTNGAEFLEVEAFPTIVQKATDHPMSEMATVFDSTFSEIGPLMATSGIAPVGPAIALFHRMPTDTSTFEAGFPVSKPLEESHTTDAGIVVEASELPGGTIARYSYIGPFDGLGDAWTKFGSEIEAAGKKMELPFWEVYVTEPHPDGDPSKLRTDLVTRVSG